jgi:hypothetical protein
VPLYEVGSGRWTQALDPASGVGEALPEYVARAVLAGGLVDGLFFDWATSGMSWLNHRTPPASGPIDLDRDGTPEPDEAVDEGWRRGYRAMLANAEGRFPPGTVMVGNAGWNGEPVYEDLLHGIAIEGFTQGTAVDEARFGWAAIMRTYGRYATTSREPRLSVVVVNTDEEHDFSLVRFGLASALLYDGYFSATNRSDPYVATRWYDEYAVDPGTGRSVRDPRAKGYLGRPLGPARAVDGDGRTLAEVLERDPGPAAAVVWRRDFEHGVVLVNPGPSAQDVDVGTGLRRIRGIADPAHNDGSEVRTIRMEPRSGEVLLRSAPSTGHGSPAL